MTQREKHIQAFESFATRVKDNPNVIGFLIYGSLAYGTVTESSDIDLVVFVRDGSVINDKAEWSEYIAYEDCIEIHPAFVQVSKFKRRMQKMIAGDWTLSQFSKGILKYCKDESLTQFFEAAKKVGKSDAALGIVRDLGRMIVEMHRAKKWITALDDPLYAQQFLQRACLWAAEIVMLLHGEHPDRESKPRAMELNPTLMREIYVKPSTSIMMKEEISHTLQVMDNFIMEHVSVWSKPILTFLADGESKTANQFNAYFGFEVEIMSYMVSKGIIERVPRTTKIFKNSKLTLEEPAYVYTHKEGNLNEQ